MDMRLEWTDHDHALKAVTTGFMIAVLCFFRFSRVSVFELRAMQLGVMKYRGKKINRVVVEDS